MTEEQKRKRFIEWANGLDNISVPIGTKFSYSEIIKGKDDGSISGMASINPAVNIKDASALLGCNPENWCLPKAKGKNYCVESIRWLGKNEVGETLGYEYIGSKSLYVANVNANDPYFIFSKIKNNFESEVSRLYNIQTLQNIFGKIFDCEKVPYCNVTFVDSFSISILQRKIRSNIVQNCFDILTCLEKELLSNYNSRSYDDEILNLIADIKRAECNSGYIRKNQILSKVSEIVDKYSNVLSKTAKKFLKKFLGLASTLVSYSDDFLGLYNQKTREILLCEENIVATAKSNNVCAVALAESVLYHEYVHHVLCSALINKVDDEFIFYAVQETFATAMEIIFSRKINNNALTGLKTKYLPCDFPFNFYAGGNVLANACVKLGIDETTVYKQVYELSINSYQKAFAFIRFLQGNDKTGKITADNSYIFNDDDCVWGFSTNHIIYCSKNPFQIKLKNTLKNAVAELDATGHLFAELFVKKARNKFDVENPLIYDIGTSTFSKATKLSLSFRRAEVEQLFESEILNVFDNICCYHYKVQKTSPSFPIKQRANKCCWGYYNKEKNGYAIDKINSNNTPLNYFEIMRNPLNSISLPTKNFESCDKLAMEIRVETGKSGNPKYVACFIKSLIDGIVSAFHRLPNNVMIDEFIRESIKKLRAGNKNKSIKDWWNVEVCIRNQSQVCFPDRIYYNNNLKYKNIGWNPEDELIRLVKVEIVQGKNNTPTISGRIYDIR